MSTSALASSVHYVPMARRQGMLSRILNKKYNYQAEVIDPATTRWWACRTASARYVSDMASYYDLVIGLHPDEAVREVVESAKVRPVLVVPCCNFWDRTRKLGTKEMVADICKWLEENGIRYETVTFSFKGPKNIGILTYR
ncbi:MAG: hypothetical protein ACLRSY_03210 [Acutalibacter sp.]